MKIKQNIGILNALIRITVGLTVLSWSSAHFTKKPWCTSYLFYMICGAMKVAEGIVRYCPITDLLQNAQTNFQWQRNNTGDKSDRELDEPLPYNPT